MPTVVRSERRKDRRSVPVRVIVRLLLLLVAALVFADTTVGERGLIAVFHAEHGGGMGDVREIPELQGVGTGGRCGPARICGGSSGRGGG